MTKKEANSKTNKILKRILITFIILILLAIGFYFITNLITKHTGFFVINNNLEKCLKEKNIILYINSYNSEETLNSLGVKGYLENIEIFNCLRNNEYCINNGVNYFPSWVIEDKVVIAELNIEELAEISGCGV